MLRRLSALLLCLVLLAAMVGCGKKEAPSLANVAATAPVTEPVTEPVPETTVPPCPHQWQEATYHTPKTCALCGETQGEPLENYFAFNDLPIEPLQTLELPILLYALRTPNTPIIAENLLRYKSVPAEMSFQPVTVERPGDGTQIITLSTSLKGQLEKNEKGETLTGYVYRSGLYDLYTGVCYDNLAPKDENGFSQGVLNLDGREIPFSMLNQYDEEYGDWTPIEDGGMRMSFVYSKTYVLTLPEDYDGLVFGLFPIHGPFPSAGSDESDLVYAVDDNYDGDARFFRVTE